MGFGPEEALRRRVHELAEAFRGEETRLRSGGRSPAELGDEQRRALARRLADHMREGLGQETEG
jgi:hypothetical protein